LGGVFLELAVYVAVRVGDMIALIPVHGRNADMLLSLCSLHKRYTIRK